MSLKSDRLVNCDGCRGEYFEHELRRRNGGHRYCDDCSSIEPELADETLEFLRGPIPGGGNYER